MATPVLDKRTADPANKRVNWSFQLYLPGRDRRQVKVSKVDFPTEKKARAEAQRQYDELASRGVTVTGDRREKFRDYGERVLTNRISDRVNELVSPKTERGDLINWRLYIAPTPLGSLPMHKVNHLVLQTFVRSLLNDRDDKKRASDGKRRPMVKKLGKRTRGAICQRVKIVLARAVREGLVSANDVSRVQWAPLTPRPSSEKVVIEAGALATARERLLDRSTFDLNLLRFELWSSTGCRPGEIAGLQWSDVEILPPGAVEGACALIHIRQVLITDRDKQFVLKPPKTAASVRDLFLPEHVRPVLLRVRQMQTERRAAPPLTQLPKLAAHPDWWFVATNQWGTASHTGSMSWFLTRWREHMGLPKASPYAFRYSAGGQSAADGDIVATSRMLGHASTKTTMLAYTPVDQARLTQSNLNALKRIHGILPAGKPGTPAD